MELISDIPQTAKVRISQMLTVILASEFMLYSKTRIAHWNVEGFDFYYKHTFFEDQYKQLDLLVEEVAERLRSLNAYAPATPQALLQMADAAARCAENNDGRNLVKELLVCQEALLEQLRTFLKKLEADLYETGGREFIIHLLDTHEKMAWMLRAHLK